MSHKLKYHFNVFILLLFIVDAGTRAVIFDKFKGIQAVSVGEGTHFKIPFIQEPKIIDVRSRPRVIHSSTGTKDLQMVSYYYPTSLPILYLHYANNNLSNPHRSTSLFVSYLDPRKTKSLLYTRL